MGYNGAPAELHLTEQLMRRLASVETLYGVAELSAGERTLPDGDLLLNVEIGLEYRVQYLRSDVEGASPRGAHVHMATTDVTNLIQAEPLRFVKGGLQQLVQGS
jgi:hypothetical protein